MLLDSKKSISTGFLMISFLLFRWVSHSPVWWCAYSWAVLGKVENKSFWRCCARLYETQYSRFSGEPWCSCCKLDNLENSKHFVNDDPKPLRPGPGHKLLSIRAVPLLFHRQETRGNCLYIKWRTRGRAAKPGSLWGLTWVFFSSLSFFVR